MFDVGFWELALIFGVGLLILGPEKMPRVASQIGRWVGRARRTASTLRRQLEQEIATADSPPRRKPKPLTPVNSPTSAAKDARSSGGDNQPDSTDVDKSPAPTGDDKQTPPAGDDKQTPPAGEKQGISPEDAEHQTKKPDTVVGQSADDS